MLHAKSYPLDTWRENVSHQNVLSGKLHYVQLVYPHHLPDVVIAEFGELGLVEVDAPRRGI